MCVCVGPAPSVVDVVVVVVVGWWNHRNSTMRARDATTGLNKQINQ